ncbi:hypothetical protein [Bailinhaonella thermotolerans]|uniref:Uncharacterized protein n=1 Tax=Bailinhaonella thermotolerans TaxID=1070861 RepID=A0A3A4AM51_9ACTN|nr:hypothetical protein [Bailinhaonella thermotolerans]RJL30021.1 hypothetical protein D5H75_24080 [Bailinhaonella thermotolerans]
MGTGKQSLEHKAIEDAVKALRAQLTLLTEGEGNVNLVQTGGGGDTSYALNRPEYFGAWPAARDFHASVQNAHNQIATVYKALVEEVEKGALLLDATLKGKRNAHAALGETADRMLI